MSSWSNFVELLRGPEGTKAITVFSIVLLVGIADSSTIVASPLIVLALNGVLLLGLLIASATRDGPLQQLLVVTALVPVVRIASMSVPTALDNGAARIALAYLPLGVGTIVAARALRYTPRDLGLSLNALGWQALFGYTGFAIGGILWLLRAPLPLIHVSSAGELVWSIFSLVLFTGFCEELFFRGLLQTAAVRHLGPRWGVAYSALIFGEMSLGSGSASYVLLVTTVGLLFAMFVLRTRSIAGSTISHALSNVMLFIVLQGR